MLTTKQTPLNNNIRELFNLMNFLDPVEWRDLEALAKEHEVLTEDSVKELHTRLRPYFLRRIKSEVLELPPKVVLFHLYLPFKLICSTEWGHRASKHESLAEGDLSVYPQWVTTFRLKTIMRC